MMDAVTKARATFHAEGLFELLEPGGRADENGRVRFVQGLVDCILKVDRCSVERANRRVFDVL